MPCACCRGTSGEKHTIQTKHTFHVIRSFDASDATQRKSNGGRGSWMQGRPFAVGPNELNPDALIYVEICPEAYERTYVHNRYINAKGTTQRVEPGPRLQPMTVAAFRQLGRKQVITRVSASRYEEQVRGRSIK